MTRRELIDLCLSFPGALETYPFEEPHCILRHAGNGKWFALVMMLEDRLCINLKCEPMQADFWRQVYADCVPGWHMNKHHWNTIRVDGDVPLEELEAMISHSHGLTRPKMRKQAGGQTNEENK